MWKVGLGLRGKVEYENGSTDLTSLSTASDTGLSTHVPERGPVLAGLTPTEVINKRDGIVWGKTRHQPAILQKSGDKNYETEDEANKTAMD